MTEIALQPWTEDDLDLLRRANAPELMVHLGGPETEEQIVARHRRYVEGDTFTGQLYSIRLGREPVGTIGYWEKDWQGETVFETGWTVLPEFQRRGIAVAATRAVIEEARAAGGCRHLHAFPSVENDGSNGVCRKAGFTLLGTYDFEYPKGHWMRCNDWGFDLMAVVPV
ncbi:MAG TPA: GNAT family N-acetyltransferase [Kribbellaceae bacterium]|nr:GNAT family N-acetyltransferase [Kribbellaceae bacterium]